MGVRLAGCPATFFFTAAHAPFASILLVAEERCSDSSVR